MEIANLGVFIPGDSIHTNIQAAYRAAQKAPGGAVWIPPFYTVGDSVPASPTVPIFDMRTTGSFTGTANVATSPTAISSYYPIAPVPDSGNVFIFIAPRAITFPINFAGSYAISFSQPTGSTIVSILKNGVSVGTMTFSTVEGAPAVFSAVAATTLAAGDALAFTGPANNDATAGFIALTLLGTWV